MVIELNPFEPWTSGALFDWEKDMDVVLGEAPFEFRLHTELQYPSPPLLLFSLPSFSPLSFLSSLTS